MATTIRNTEVRSINRDTVCIAGNDVQVAWLGDGGAFVSVDAIAAIRDAADANWSKDEMGQLAYHAEVVMSEAFGDAVTKLCDATPDQLARFDSAARAAGHPSGKSVANECGLWDSTVAEAIARVSGAEEAE